MPWVFVYGSLVWDPPFESEERVNGVLEGYHRAFNKQSTQNWGTSDAPGPVLGLEPGGECEGVAFRIAEENIAEVTDKIDDREGPSYDTCHKEIQLEDGRTITATVWINDRSRFTYIGDKSLAERAQMALNASGEKGPAKQYAIRTRNELAQLNIDAPHVEEFAAEILNHGE